MGTLFKQSVKGMTKFPEDWITRTSEELAKLKEEGYSSTEALRIMELTRQDFRLAAEYDRQNAWDEQIGGLGELLQRAVVALEQLVEGREG